MDDLGKTGLVKGNPDAYIAEILSPTQVKILGGTKRRAKKVVEPHIEAPANTSPTITIPLGSYGLVDLMLKVEIGVTTHNRLRLIESGRVYVNGELVKENVELEINNTPTFLEVGNLFKVNVVGKLELETVPESEIIPTGPPTGVYLRFDYLSDGSIGRPSFIGVIQSLDPFVVIEHFLLGGVHSETELDNLNPKDWALQPMTKDQVFSTLY